LSMASGAEIVSYYQDVMERVFLPTGRVTYHPMTRFDWRGHATSLVSGKRCEVKARARNLSMLHMPQLKCQGYINASFKQWKVCSASR
jgi:hypothetical protein